MADRPPCNPNSGRHMRSASYKNSCNHDQLPELPNFKPRTQRMNMNMEKNQIQNPAEFAKLLIEKLEKVKIDSDQKQKLNERQMPPLQDQRLSSPYHHHGGPNNMHLPSYYPDDILDDSQSWIMPPASDRYSVAGASSHSGSGANMEKNRNIKEKAKELHNAVHHSLRNRLGECECHSCALKRQEKSFHHSTYSKDSSRHSSDHCRRSAVGHCSVGCCCQGGGTGGGKDNAPYPPLYRKFNSEESSHRTVDYPLENVNEDFIPPMDNTKIYAWMERNERLADKTFPDHAPSPAVRRKKQLKCGTTSTQTVQPIAQDLGMPLIPPPDTGNVLEEVKRVLEEPEQRSSPIAKIPSRTHQMVPQPPQLPPQQQLLQQQYSQQQQPQPPYHYTGDPHHPQHPGHPAYSETSYDHNPNGSLSTSNWSHSDTHSRISYDPSISTVPSSASRLWNADGYYDSSSDVRLENKSGASKSHSTGTGRHTNRSDHHTSRSDHHTSRSDHRSDHHTSRSDHHTSRSDHHGSRSDHRSSSTRRDGDSQSNSHSQRTHGSQRSHGSDSNKTQTTTVTYYFDVDPIPFRISVPSSEVTLGQFTKSLTKKGNFRYFFKTISKDDGEVVYEEVGDENQLLPRFKDKIIGKVEKIE